MKNKNERFRRPLATLDFPISQATRSKATTKESNLRLDRGGPCPTDTQQVTGDRLRGKKKHLPFKAHIPQDFFVATTQEIRPVRGDSEAQILSEPIQQR